jgi:hypothetical protein
MALPKYFSSVLCFHHLLLMHACKCSTKIPRPNHSCWNDFLMWWHKMSPDLALSFLWKFLFVAKVAIIRMWSKKIFDYHCIFWLHTENQVWKIGNFSSSLPVIENLWNHFVFLNFEFHFLAKLLHTKVICGLNLEEAHQDVFFHFCGVVTLASIHRRIWPDLAIEP